MAEITLDETKLKELLKTAIIELLEEQKEEFSELLTEALEDIGMKNAIKEGEKTDLKPEQKTANFWDALQTFRAKIEKESIVFNDDDFANLRDKSPGREVEL